MEDQTNKSFEILYNAAERVSNMDPDPESVYMKDDDGNFIAIGDMIPEKAEGIIKQIKNSRKKDLAFFISFQKPIMELLHKLTPAEMKLLLFLASVSSYGNKIKDLGYDEIAEKAHMSKSTVTKYMATLKKKKCIHAKPYKNRFIYTINPAIFWRGSFYGIKQTMDLFVEDEGRQA